MKGPRILVLDADHTIALAIVRALGPRLEVWTASRKGRVAVAAWSRHVRKHLVYDFDLPGPFASWVLASCRQHHIDVVVAIWERHALLLSEERERFAAHGITLATPPAEALQIVIDKALTVAAAQEAGVPVPPTRVLQAAKEAIPAARELGYPVVLKPRSSEYYDGRRFRWTGPMRYADSEQELANWLKTLPGGMQPPLLQKFIPGHGLGIFLLLSRDGAVCAEFAHERLRDKNPTGSGSVLRRAVKADPRLREQSLALLRRIGWWGPAMVEFHTDDRNGAIYLMEINGRFWGSLQLAIDAGVDFPSLLVDVALGKKAQAPGYREGVVLRWWLGDLVRLLHVLLGRPPGFTGPFPSRLAGLVDFFGPQPPGTRNEVFRRTDPRPAIAEVLALAQSFGDKVIYPRLGKLFRSLRVLPARAGRTLTHPDGAGYRAETHVVSSP